MIGAQTLFLGKLVRNRNLGYKDFVRPRDALNAYAGIAGNLIKTVRGYVGDPQLDRDLVFGYARQALDDHINGTAIRQATEEMGRQPVRRGDEAIRLYELVRSRVKEEILKDPESVLGDLTINNLAQDVATRINQREQGVA